MDERHHSTSNNRSHIRDVCHILLIIVKIGEMQHGRLITIVCVISIELFFSHIAQKQQRRINAVMQASSVVITLLEYSLFVPLDFRFNPLK